MNRYLFEMQLAPQAFAAYVKNPGDRRQANAAVLESLGGKLLEIYFSVGSSTIFTMVELPDPMSVEAAAMAVLAGGAVNSIKCVGILTAAEAVEAMEMASGAGYQAPAQ